MMTMTDEEFRTLVMDVRHEAYLVGVDQAVRRVLYLLRQVGAPVHLSVKIIRHLATDATPGEVAACQALGRRVEDRRAAGVPQGPPQTPLEA